MIRILSKNVHKIATFNNNLFMMSAKEINDPTVSNFIKISFFSSEALFIFQASKKAKQSDMKRITLYLFEINSYLHLYYLRLFKTMSTQIYALSIHVGGWNMFEFRSIFIRFLFLIFFRGLFLVMKFGNMFNKCFKLQIPYT